MFTTTPELLRAVISDRMREAEEYRRTREAEQHRRHRLTTSRDAKPRKRQKPPMRWPRRRIVVGVRR